MSSSYIGGPSPYTSTVLLNGTNFGPTLLIGPNALIAPSGAGGVGVLSSVANAALTNEGKIQGGAGLGMGPGGTGVYLIGGKLTNAASGTIDGGLGSGIGVDLEAGTVDNAGSIIGGASARSATAGGTGVTVAAGATLNNRTTGLSQSITGGLGHSSAAGVGGSGGTGVNLASGAHLFDSGQIYGGYGGDGFLGGGGGGVGVIVGSLATMTVDQGGFIQGGGGGVAKKAGANGGAGAAGVDLNGGTLTVDGSIQGGYGGAAGRGGASGGYGDAVDFGAGGTMIVQANAHFKGAIGGFAIGDRIEFANLTPARLAADFGVTDTKLAAGVYEFAGSRSGETLNGTSYGAFQIAGDFSQAQFILTADGAGTDLTLVACYLRGTRILTERGELPIECLAIGDRVVTLAGGIEPIRWIGRRRYTREFAAGRSDLWPIKISRGALGGGLPRRDLWVSPEHALYLDGMLIPAAALVNGFSIAQDRRAREIRYFHLEFAAHAVIYAEGAPAESFVDDDSRAMFDNAAEFAALYPQAQPAPARFCAPRVEDGEELESVRARLARRFAHAG